MKKKPMPNYSIKDISTVSGNSEDAIRKAIQRKTLDLGNFKAVVLYCMLGWLKRNFDVEGK